MKNLTAGGGLFGLINLVKFRLIFLIGFCRSLMIFWRRPVQEVLDNLGAHKIRVNLPPWIHKIGLL